MTDRGLTLRSFLRSAALGALMALGFVACGESVTLVDVGDIVDVRLSTDSAMVAVGGAVQFRALPLDSTGALLVAQDVAWSILDPAVATVDDTGLVTGMTIGVTQVSVSVAGVEASAIVVVAPPPTIVLDQDTVTFSLTAGEADPSPDTVMVTNGSTFPVLGLAVDSIVYGAGAQDWVGAQLSSAAAPASLALSPMTSGVTTAGRYTATVWLFGIDAENSPAPVVVVLDVAAAPASAISMNDGDGQSAAAGATLATRPSVLITDAFGNAVSGASVTFAVTAGGGSVTGGTAITDASGVARVGSWTLGTTAGAQALGATVAGAGSVSFSATALPGAPTTLELESGDGQTALAGSAVGVSPTVRVRDVYGNLVDGVSVAFTVTVGGGSVTGSPATSAADGTAAATSWVLGSVPGTNELIATVAGLADTVTFTATGLSPIGAPTQMSLAAGDAQTDSVAATLPSSYSVLVQDENDNPVPGITVTWTVTGGTGGTITSSSVTDASGVATATRVLGTVAGSQTASGSVGGLTGSPVNFSATATAGAPATIALSAGSGQSATVNTALAIDPAVLVEDQFGNPVAGESVTFSVTAGGGAVVPTTPVSTNASGVATVTSWTVGTAAGTNNNTLSALAASGSVSGNPVALTASATAGAPASIAMTSGDAQTAVTGLNVANQPTVTVSDAFANPVPGATVDFAASGGGSVGTASASTNGSGVAMTTWTVTTDSNGTMSATGTYTNTLTATVQGTALSTQFSGFARYSFATHVNPIFSGCTGCHGGAGGLSLSGTAAQNYAAIVDVVPNCDNTTGYRRISAAGGVNAADVLSILLRRLDPDLTDGTCAVHPVEFASGAAQLDIIRAWIRNSAPNN